MCVNAPQDDSSGWVERKMKKQRLSLLQNVDLYRTDNHSISLLHHHSYWPSHSGLQKTDRLPAGHLRHPAVDTEVPEAEALCPVTGGQLALD